MFSKLIEAFAAWLARQEVNTVMLVLILGSNIWMGYYAMTVGVPAHLSQIQTGYERIEASHEKQIDRVIKIMDTKRESATKDTSDKSTLSLPENYEAYTTH